MATRASAQSGNWSATSTWAGGVVPVAGDTAVIAPGHTVTLDVDADLGSSASGIGIGLTVQGTSATVYGRLVLSAGVTLTLRGFDRTTNAALLVQRYARFDAGAGTVVIDSPSAWGTGIRAEGVIVGRGTRFTIPPSRHNWNNAGEGVYTNRPTYRHDNDRPISKLKIQPTVDGINKAGGSGRAYDPGYISNAAGTGRGRLETRRSQ